MDVLENVVHDLVVLGAGVYGLPMAKTYLQVHPKSKVVVLDPHYSVGGTWASERLYEGLKTNNFRGIPEYSDFPMDYETFGIADNEHPTGKAVHEYLTAYAKKFGVFERVRFGCKAVSAKMDDDTWIISYELKAAARSEPELKTLKTKHLVMATGTTTEPNLAPIPNSQNFKGPILHSKHMASRQSDMDKAKRIVVLGGSKSATDAVYINANKGKHVDWIMRSSGKGPAWISQPGISPLKIQIEKLATTRVMSLFIPCYDSDRLTYIRRFFHESKLGRFVVKTIFSYVANELITKGKFRQHDETAKLIPRSNIFWSGSSIGIFNYDSDLFELAKTNKFNVHNADVVSVTENSVVLSDGKELPADLIISCTGWKHFPTVSILPEWISSGWHAPLDPSDPKVQEADEAVFRRYPILRNQPMSIVTDGFNREQSGWELYHGLVPPSLLENRNFAYSGQAVGIRGWLLAEVEALWITALFDDNFVKPLPSFEEASWDALLRRRFWRYRSPNGQGVKGTQDMVFEMIPFVDSLLEDLGLESSRKRSWLAEMFSSYESADFKNIVDDYIAKNY